MQKKQPKCTNLNGIVVAFTGSVLTGITKVKAVNGDRTEREYNKSLKTLLARKWGARRAARWIKEHPNEGSYNF